MAGRHINKYLQKTIFASETTEFSAKFVRIAGRTAIITIDFKTMAERNVI